MTRQIPVAFLLLIVTLLGCVKKRDLSSETVVAHILSTPSSLHPVNGNGEFRTYIFKYTQRPLFDIDLRTMEYIPLLIKSMPDTIGDPQTYVFELRDDVFWDDGSPVMGEDLVFLTKVMIAPPTDNHSMKNVFESIFKKVWVDENNPRKVYYKTKELRRTGANAFEEVYLMQKSYWDSTGVLDDLTFEQIAKGEFTPEQEAWFSEFNLPEKRVNPKYLFGLGPYQVTVFEAGSHVRLERKAQFWGEGDTLINNKAFPKTILFKIIKDETPLTLALKSEKIDVSNKLGTNQLIKLRKHDYFNENYYTEYLDQFAYYYFGMNLKPEGTGRKPFFKDKKVRWAMSYSVPTDEIIEVVFKGKASRQTNNVSPLKKSFNTKCTPIPFDLKKAAALLDSAGWKDSDGNGIRDKVINGEKIQFSFTLNYMSSPVSKDVALLWADKLKLLGIEMKFNPMDFAQFYEDASKHEFDVMMGAWGGGSSYSDPIQLWGRESWANKGSNFVGFGSEQSDSLINACNNTLSYDEFIKAYHALQWMIYQEQPYVFLFSPTRKVAIHKRFISPKAYVERPNVYLNALELKSNFKIPVSAE